jgi:NCS1 family nucleobase:cation symporter-1
MDEQKNQVTLPDGRVELIHWGAVEASPLYNHDLAPVPISAAPGRPTTSRRCGSRWRTASRPTCWPRASWRGNELEQALFTILLGNTIVLIPILLNSHPGTKYGIPFPVFARAAYGTAARTCRR